MVCLTIGVAIRQGFRVRGILHGFGSGFRLKGGKFQGSRVEIEGSRHIRLPEAYISGVQGSD